MASQQWHTPRRLRHLEAVSARNLLLADTTPPPRAYFSLSVPTGTGGQCNAVYRSEAVGGGDINPDWMPLSWPSELQLAGQAGEVVLAVHQLPAGCEHLAPALSTPRLYDEGGPTFRLRLKERSGQPEARQSAEQEARLGDLEVPPAADSQLASAAAAAAAEDVEGQLVHGPRPDAEHQPDKAEGRSTNPPGEGAAHPVDHAAAGEAADAEGSTFVAIGSAAEPSLQACNDANPSLQQEQRQQQQQHEEAQGAAPGQQQEQEGPQGGKGGPASPQQQLEQQEPGRHPPLQQQEGKQSEAQGGAAMGKSNQEASPKAAQQARWGAPPAVCGFPPEAFPGERLAVCGFPPEAFPGELLAVWALDLNHLHMVGEDLGPLREPLGPNSVLLELDGAYYAHPPPLQPEAPALGAAALLAAYTQSSPTKRSSLVAAAGERPALSSPQGSAPRRFASMLMSKLLRSTPNLQEAVDGRGYDSDAESDAASEASGWTRLTNHTAARESAALSSSAFTKAMSLSDLRLHITALVSLRASVLELHQRTLELRCKLEGAVEARQQAREQEDQLRQAQQEAQRSRQQAQLAKQQLGQVQEELAAVRKAASVRAQALVTTLRVMQAADRKLRDAQDNLQGDQGRERLVGLHRELVARRCLMVTQLGRTFQLGPITVKVPEAPPGGYLEDRLERQWLGAGGERGASSSFQEHGGFPGPPPANSSAAVDTPRHYRQEVHLSIGGIELRPAVWRAAFDDGAGPDISDADDEMAAVALGYVAHFVDRLADYLDVPLRYPLCLLGSKSSIYDSSPPCGTWSVGEPAKRGLFSRSDSSSAAATAGRPTQYPLYCAARRERPQFAIGVFLLNKDIVQLLQAHGISAGGPNQLLHNLYALLQAAQIALTPA